MASEDDLEFSFSWRALELLGKGLYSNPWNAIAELVANGFDARASDVYIYIDLRRKENAVVEIVDNGTGMDRAVLSEYVQVGHDKRAAGSTRGAEAGLSTDYMGRKGIGKLAALYLSPLVRISTRTSSERTHWVLDARPERRSGLDDRPYLVATRAQPDGPGLDLWKTMQSGTRIHLADVDMTRTGARTIRALKQLLANQFLPASNRQRQIYLWVHTADDDWVSGEDVRARFSPVEKRIAFQNMAFIEHQFSSRHPDPEGLASADFLVTFPPRDKRGDAHEHQVETRSFQTVPDQNQLWPGFESDLDLEARKYRGRSYRLTGWVGIHATIRTDEAEKNDERFLRNGTYNPAQIRLYVRGKLASDRLLNQLGLTRQYLNYVEGELSFDILDDDFLPDIATASRQDFDETDDRVALLRAIVRPIVQRLIGDRQRLVSRFDAQDRQAREDAKNRAKAVFAEQIGADLATYVSIPEATRDEIQLLAMNKLQGDVEIKNEFVVFLSHSSRDSPFTDFIYEILISRGARPEEIFYTSRPDDVSGYKNLAPLQQQIRDKIKAKNTLLFYFTSDSFLGSQYCMFEGGAGWITRSVGEFRLLSVRFRDVPEFLTNGKMEFSLLRDSLIELRPDVHQYIVDLVLNPMIDHLNQGRSITGDDMIRRFDVRPFPSKVELRDSGASLEQFYDRAIVDHWDVHVAPIAVEYVTALRDRESKRE